MLVRRGVEDDLRLEPAEDFPHPVRAGDVADERFHDVALDDGAEFLLDEEKLRLGALHEQEFLWAEGQDLPAKFAADAAACASDHDGAPAQAAPHASHFDLHRRAPEQVLNLDGAKHGDADPARGQLIERRHGAARQARLLNQVHDFARPFRRRGGHGDDQFIETQAVAQLGDALRVADHGDAVDARARVAEVVEERHRTKAEPGFGE